MRILVSDHSQVGFCDHELDTAKVFYSPPVFDEKIEKEIYIGTDFKGYKAAFLEYQDRISSAKSIDELASILNRYTDTFEDGARFSIKEYPDLHLAR